MNKNNPIARETRTLWLYIAIAAAGILVSLSLSHHFYSIRTGAATFKSYCNVSQTFNCDAVSSSSYSEFAFGLPLSAFGTGWFVCGLLFALMGLGLPWRRDAVRALFLSAAGGLVFSIYYFSVMAFVLKTFCLFCLLVDVVNIALFACALMLRPEWIKPHKPDAAKWKIIIAAGLAAMTGSISLTKAAFDVPVKTSDAQEIADRVLATAPVQVGAGTGFPSVGPAGAPITIVEFSDFQCPYCRNGALVINSILNLYHGKVRMVFRNLPLDPACNRTMKYGGHMTACEAARVVTCAHRAGSFEPVYEALFENQALLAGRKAVQIAVEAGMDEAALKSCMESKEAHDSVSRDIEESISLGFQSTPTFFVNGHKVEGAYPVAVWKAIIDRLLAAK
ncbi:MAG: hypothetical protein A2583_04370 [Bdellovibrionales bacterium RIFOXYD1_FULL_53_11]|nr:MAG: hypothetical protein A2583_04370 [Bdellovibrionales bacterium RIFOXYD1_FULL_53_11]